MDSQQHKLPTLTISLPEVASEIKTVCMSINWDKGSNHDDVLRLAILALYEDMSDIIIQSIHEQGMAIEDVTTAQIIIDRFVKAKMLLDRVNNAPSKRLVIDPEEIFKSPQRPTI